jgi:hypothetical protein
MKHLFPLIILPFLALTGCTGTVKCSLVSNNMSDITVEPTDARTITLDCPECYWWVDEDNRVNIAGRKIARSLINSRYDFEFYITFVLGEPSQGVGKNYQLNQTSIRGLVKSGGNILRFQGTYGILGSENRKSDTLISAYRSGIGICSSKLFGGWSNPVPFLIYGTLTAVPDRENKGKSWRKLTEAEGYERKFFRPRNSAIK